MAGVNKVILIGNLGRDPEVRRLQDGKMLVALSVATSESWTDKRSGERRERTHWHRVVVFKERECEFAEKLKKGTKVWAEGAIRSRKWTDKDGNDQFAIEVCIDGFTHGLKSMAAGGGSTRGADSPDEYGVDDESDDHAPLPSEDDYYIPMT